MKRNASRIIVLLFVFAVFAACGCKSSHLNDRALEHSNVWTLGERYPVNYSSLTYFVTYEAAGEPFCLKATRNAKETGMNKHVLESRNIDGIVYALCEYGKTGADGNTLYTFYECYTGNYRYFIGRESEGFHIEDILSLTDAVELINSPESPSRKIKFCEAEWNALYRTDACNLEILIRPNDKGALIKSLSSGYLAQTEGGETYYISSGDDEIAYTDGTNSVQIRQANRSGADVQSYHTLSECKAVLSLLGSN